jgi:hypothetical protein
VSWEWGDRIAIGIMVCSLVTFVVWLIPVMRENKAKRGKLWKGWDWD